MGSGTGREIVIIHIGQAGLQIGAAMWELFCQEHNIDNQGAAIPLTDRAFEMVGNLFYETDKQKFVPRCVQVDLEPSVMDEIRCGVYRDLYLPSCLINSCPDAANNFARGALTNGQNVLENVMQAIRRLTNLCDNVATFKIVHSFTGGTGSGLTSQIVEQISDIYGKKFKFGMGVYPSTKFSQAMVDPYNTLLLTNSTIDHMDCVCVFDNESLYNIMTNCLGVDGPHFIHINRIMAQMISSLTLAHRFRYNDSKHSDLDELMTNLVPFPRIHFPLVSYAPLVNWDEQAHMGFSVGELTDACFAAENQTLNVDVSASKYFSCAMLYRGWMSSKEVYDSLNRVKACKNIQFVDWCPTGFKVALNMCKPFVNKASVFASGDRAVCMIAGNACISQAWKRVKTKFELLYSRRAFIHWYVAEGMEESDFSVASTMVDQLTDDYKEIAAEVAAAGASTNESNVTKIRGSTLRRMSLLKEEKVNTVADVFKRQSIMDIRSNNNNFNNFNNFAPTHQDLPVLNEDRMRRSVEVMVRPEALPRRDLKAKLGRNRSAAVPQLESSSDGNSEKPKVEPNLAKSQEVLYNEAINLLSNLNLQRLIYSMSGKRDDLNEERLNSRESGSKDSASAIDSKSDNIHFQNQRRDSKATRSVESDTSVTSNTYGSDFALMEFISKNNNCTTREIPSPAPRHQVSIRKDQPIDPRPSPRITRLRLRSSTGDISTSSTPPSAEVIGRPLAMSRLSCSVTENVSYVPFSKPPGTLRRESVESLFEEETCSTGKHTPRLPRKGRLGSMHDINYRHQPSSSSMTTGQQEVPPQHQPSTHYFTDSPRPMRHQQHAQLLKALQQQKQQLQALQEKLLQKSHNRQKQAQSRLQQESTSAPARER